MKSKITLLAVLMTVVMLFVSACGGSATPTQEAASTQAPAADPSVIIAEGRLEPIRYAEIAFTASGTISEVLVEEGQAVKKGDPLVRLGDESDTNYAAAQLELADAQKALNDLQNTGGTDLAQAIIDLKDATEEYDDAVDYLDYLNDDNKIAQTQTIRILKQTWKGYQYETKEKNFKGPAPEDWIIEAENDLALKKAKVDALQRDYDRLKGGVDADQLAVQEARLNAAKASVASFSVVAPFDGVVADLKAKLGNSINPGEPAVTVADFSHWVINTTDLTEIDVVNLEVGQSVIVTLDAIPDVELKGTIQSIGQTFSENQGDVVYEVTVMLTDTDPAMRWGMTAEVKFEQD
ncbi:MAG TPA: HlyD family efflux transporter periplasmic adaptor subunit [Anaerolineales bacterium]|nr:HlyD family efflux transporter periplasmic adaptor subunit [Anaerolineales bacterium]